MVARLHKQFRAWLDRVRERWRNKPAVVTALYSNEGRVNPPHRRPRKFSEPRKPSDMEKMKKIRRLVGPPDSAT